MRNLDLSRKRYVVLSATAAFVVVIVGTVLAQSKLTAVSARPACSVAERTSLDAFPAGHGLCVAVGVAPTRMVEDNTVGRALIYNTWDATASVVDVATGAVVRTVALGSRYNYAYADVDTRTHHFVLSLQRGKYSNSGGNEVYLLDALSGAVLKALAGVAKPAEVAVDEARGHVFVADALKSSVLMYDTRTGALLRAVPSCQDTELLALSRRTGHLFVRCINGVMVMHDAATGRILAREVTLASRMDNDWRTTSGIDTQMVVNDTADRLIVSNLAADAGSGPTASLYDAQTGHLLGAVAWQGFAFADEAHGTFFVTQYNEGLPDQVVVLDGRTGDYRRTLDLPDQNVWLVRLNPRTGHLLVLLQGPHPQNGAPAGPSTLAVLDAHSGKVLRSIAVGLYAQSMFLDTRANRAGILNLGWWPKPGSLTLLALRQL